MTASRAMPAPVTPPPITRTSSSFPRSALAAHGVECVLSCLGRQRRRPHPWSPGGSVVRDLRRPARPVRACSLSSSPGERTRNRGAQTCTRRPRAGGGPMYIEREQDVLRAASMYYLQDIKMEVIARHLGTSRSTVSRLIKRARQSGLVEITLRPASTRAPGLGRTIAAAFGIDTYVVPVPGLRQPHRAPRPGVDHGGPPAVVVVRLRHGARRRLGDHAGVGLPVPRPQADARLRGGPAQRRREHAHQRDRVRERPHLDVRHRVRRGRAPLLGARVLRLPRHQGRHVARAVRPPGARHAAARGHRRVLGGRRRGRRAVARLLGRATSTTPT